MSDSIKPVHLEWIFGFGNFGRAKSAGPVVASLHSAAAALAGTRRVFVPVEMNEGDSGYDDIELLDQAFHDWQRFHTDRKEPILVSADVTSARQGPSVFAAPGVTHQSPTRRIQAAPIYDPILDRRGRVVTPGLVVLSGHDPAGAHNGHRSPKAYRALLSAYVEMVKVHRAQIRLWRKQGYHVVWLFDTNWRVFPPLHSRERTLFHDGPDWGRVVPAKGWRARIGKDRGFRLYIEKMHQGHAVPVVFHPKRGGRA